MWVFTVDGFYSAVEHRDNPSLVMVRARAREDLKRLERLVEESGPILELPLADYPYRLVMPKRQWAGYLERTANCLDYDNFKNQIREPHRHSVYLRVWEALLALTPEYPRSKR